MRLVKLAEICCKVFARFVAVKKIQFVKSSTSEASTATNTGGDLVGKLNSLTSNIKLPCAKFPGEFHMLGHSFTGPGTRLDLRLNPDGMPKSFSMPVDRVDEAAYHHDLEYAKYADTPHRNEADRAMIQELNNIENPIMRERLERTIVKPIIGTKEFFGLGAPVKKNADSRTFCSN